MTEMTPLDNWIRGRLFSGDKRLSREKLDAYQLTAFMRTIDYAKQNSTFYRERLAVLEAGDIKSAKDIASVPLTHADDIRLFGKSMVCVGQGNISRVVTLDTSGTTGPPKRVYFTAGDQELTIDFFHHGMSVFTSPGDKVLILLPGERPGSVGDLLEKALCRMGAKGVICGTVTDFEKAQNLILDEDINVIVGVPQQILELSCMSGAHVVLEKGCLHSVLLSTDYVADAAAQRISGNWGCTVYEHYGMTETGLGGGVSCKALRGYHMREADMLFEITDPDTGRPMPEGEYGEVVFTTLTRNGMPLIRYRTGDISRFLSGRCECGTALRTMEKIRYRMPSAVRLKGGLLLTMPQLEERLFRIEEIADFDAGVSVSGDCETLELDVRTTGDDTVSEERIKNALLKSEIKGAILSGKLKIGVRRVSGRKPDLKATGKRGIKDSRP